MGGCRSCTGCAAQPAFAPAGRAEKLEKTDTSDNPRYPHIFVGKQAIFRDEKCHIIVTVVHDKCDETCDCFTLKADTIISNGPDRHSVGELFEVRQPADCRSWHLHALL